MNLSSTAAVAALALALALAGTAPAQIERPIPYPLPRSDAWNKAVAAGTRTEDGSPGPAYWTDFARYAIRAELDPQTAEVTGHVDMTYVNRSKAAVKALLVHLRQNLYKQGSLRNTFVEITGGVTLEDLRFRGEPLAPNAVFVQGTVLRVQLPESIEPGAEATLSMDWKFRVPGARGSAPRGVSVVRQGHDSHHVFYLGYWYPQFAVRDDVNGWVADHYLGNSEFYMGYADYDLSFTVPEGFLVRATGRHVNADQILTESALGRLAKARKQRDVVQVVDRDDLEAGRVTRKSANGKHTWHFVAENVRDVAVSASDRYVWDATHAAVVDSDGKSHGEAMIHTVYQPRGSWNGKAAEWARHTIEFMSREVYPYPWPHMTACEGIIGGGMEYPMMTICGGLGQGVVTHELIHMWFPMLVGSNEKAHAWQDEGVTSYWTTRTTAALKGEQVSRRQMMGGFLRSLDAPMMRHGDLYGIGRSAYGGVSYMKTEAVLRQLQSLIGDEAFFAAFRRYAADWAFKHPYPEDLFHTFAKVAGRDLDWYFRTWFYETWHLDQAVESVEEKAGKTTVVIGDKGFATWPTRVEVTYKDGKVEFQDVDVQHWLSGKRTKALEFGPGVERVRIDPDRLSLDTSRRNNTWQAPR